MSGYMLGPISGSGVIRGTSWFGGPILYVDVNYLDEE